MATGAEKLIKVEGPAEDAASVYRGSLQVQGRCSLGEWRLGAGTQHYYHYVFQLFYPTIPAFPTTNISSCSPNEYIPHHTTQYTILRNGKHYPILLFAPNTTAAAATVNVRQPSPSAHAVHRLLAMPHNPIDDSQPERLRIRLPDQSLSPPCQGRLPPDHTQSRDTHG